MSKQLKLPLECKNEDHNWSDWVSVSHYMSRSFCSVCDQTKILVPKGSHTITPLPVRSSFSVFLADFKAKWNK